MTDSGKSPDSVQQLFNAARNFQGMAENFGRIDAENLNGETIKGLERLLEILRRAGARIQVLSGTKLKKPEMPERKIDPDLHLDLAKLEKAITFSQRVATWLDSVRREGLPGRVIAVLKELGHAVLLTEMAVDLLCREFHAVVHAGVRTVSEDGSPELVLANTRQSPLLEEWQGRKELNKKAKTLLREYLDLIGFPNERRETREWERKLEKWIQATPKETILVLRLGSYAGKPTIYPKYLPKSAFL